MNGTAGVVEAAERAKARDDVTEPAGEATFEAIMPKEGRPEGAAGNKQETIMNVYEISLVWHGATYREQIHAMSAERARRAALERFPGATVLRVSRVGG